MHEPHSEPPARTHDQSSGRGKVDRRVERTKRALGAPLMQLMLEAGDGRIDGGVWPGPPSERPFVQLFVAVPDVDACIAAAKKLGAKLIVPKSTLPDGDVMAVLLDPLGLPLAICTPRE